MISSKGNPRIGVDVAQTWRFVAPCVILMIESWFHVSGVSLSSPWAHCCSGTFIVPVFDATRLTNSCGQIWGQRKQCRKQNRKGAFWDQVL